jgi:hypothetical protein
MISAKEPKHAHFFETTTTHFTHRTTSRMVHMIHGTRQMSSLKLNNQLSPYQWSYPFIKTTNGGGRGGTVTVLAAATTLTSITDALIWIGLRLRPVVATTINVVARDVIRMSFGGFCYYWLVVE